jgi:hypothetical protein
MPTMLSMRLQQDFAARGMGLRVLAGFEAGTGLSDRFAEREGTPEDRSGGASAACAGISPIWLVCVTI